jgi:PhnB protein
MRISCHLAFDGQCELAFRTYQRLLGGEIVTLLRFSESPMAKEVPSEWQQRILHATLVLDGQEFLLGSDAFPNAYERPQGFAATLGIAAPTRAKEVFEALAEGGRVQLPFQETFWSAGFGVLVDQFGVPWEINCERAPTLSP